MKDEFISTLAAKGCIRSGHSTEAVSLSAMAHKREKVDPVSDDIMYCNQCGCHHTVKFHESEGYKASQRILALEAQRSAIPPYIGLGKPESIDELLRKKDSRIAELEGAVLTFYAWFRGLGALVMVLTLALIAVW